MRTALVFFLIAAFGGTIVSAPQTKTVDLLLGQYFQIHKSLAADSINGVSAAAVQIAKISRQAAATEPSAKTQLITLSNAAAKLNASDLKSARDGFGALSDGLIAYLQAGQPKGNPPYQFYCPMVRKNWLQPDKQTRNPYYGSSMLTCGELVQQKQSAKKPGEHPHQ